MRHGLLGLVLVLLATSAAAQTTELRANRFRWLDGPCVSRSGSASPEGAVTGSPCDLYGRTDGRWWRKATGTGTSGWEIVPAISADNAWSVKQTHAGGLDVTGTSSLLAAYGGSGGFGLHAFNASPVNARLFIGDGSGWQLRVASRTGSATTDRITFTDQASLYPSTNYTGYLGTYQYQWLSVYAAELSVQTLVAQDVIATIGGNVLVAPTTVLTTDVESGDTTIYVKHNELASGDRVILKAAGKFEALAITSAPGGAGPYSYTVTRDLDGTGANAWYAGDAVLNTGTMGDGFLDLYSRYGLKSTSEYGPTIVGNVRTSSAWNAWSPRWAIGNLNGLYGYSSTTYGSAFGDGTATHVTVDATNGFRVRNGSTTMLQADASGDLWMTPNPYQAWADQRAIRWNTEDTANRVGYYGYDYNISNYTAVGQRLYSLVKTDDTTREAYANLEAEVQNADGTKQDAAKLTVGAIHSGSPGGQITGSAESVTFTYESSSLPMRASFSHGAHTSATTPLLSQTATWNNGAGTFTGIYSNITDTASAAASKFIDLQVGSATKWALQKDGAVFERGRTTAMGEWTTRAFSAGNFGGCGSMTWTVESGDVTTEAWTIVGTTATYSLKIADSATSGTAANCVVVTLPTAITSNRAMGMPVSVYSSSAWGTGIVNVAAGGNTMTIYNDALAVFGLARVDLQLVITFEIQ